MSKQTDVMQIIDGKCTFENINISFGGTEILLANNMSLTVWHKNSVMKDKLIGQNMNVLRNTTLDDISDHEETVDIVIMNEKGSKLVGNLSLTVILKCSVSKDNTLTSSSNPTTASDDNHDNISVLSDMSHFTNRTSTTEGKKNKRSFMNVFNVFKSKPARDSHEDTHHHHHQDTQHTGAVNNVLSDSDLHSETATGTITSKKKRFFTMKRLWRTKKKES